MAAEEIYLQSGYNSISQLKHDPILGQQISNTLLKHLNLETNHTYYQDNSEDKGESELSTKFNLNGANATNKRCHFYSVIYFSNL